MARGCSGGTNCTTFNCFGSGSGSASLIANGAANSESAQRIAVKTEGRSPSPLVGTFGGVPEAALSLESMVVRVGPTPAEIENISFAIRNNTAKQVTTVVLAHTFTSIAGEKAVIYQVLDLFTGRADILAGQSMPQLIDVNVKLKAPLASIDTEVTFLEFSDGSQFGSSKETAAQVFSQLRARDRRIFAKVSEILTRASENESVARIAAFLDGLPEDERCSDAVAISRYLLRTGDLENLRRLSESPRIPQRSK